MDFLVESAYDNMPWTELHDRCTTGHAIDPVWSETMRLAALSPRLTFEQSQQLTYQQLMVSGCHLAVRMFLDYQPLIALVATRARDMDTLLWLLALPAAQNSPHIRRQMVKFLPTAIDEFCKMCELYSLDQWLDESHLVYHVEIRRLRVNIGTLTSQLEELSAGMRDLRRDFEFSVFGGEFAAAKEHFNESLSVL